MWHIAAPADHTGVSTLARARLLVLAAVTAVLAVVWLAVEGVVVTADRANRVEDGVERLLTAAVDQETGLRGFAQTGQQDFLEPWDAGRVDFDRALLAVRGGVPAGELRSAVLAARAWQAAAAVGLADVRARGPGAVPAADAQERKRLMDRFRARHQRLSAVQRDQAAAAVAGARRGALLSVFGICLLFGALGAVVVERRVRRSARLRAMEDEFGEALQGAASEEEAHLLLERQIARLAPGSRAVVLRRAGDPERLQAGSRLEPGSPLAERAAAASASACLAMRRGTPHERRAGDRPLQECDVCGDVPGGALCLPSVVGGEVSGAVLTVRDGGLAAGPARRVRGAVERATPVVATLRTLADAERRAATDALTGLPNRRAVELALGRMLAQAVRTGTPLGAVVLDLDRFKSLNDVHGHQAGDAALAAVGAAVAATVRASDLAGRWGGEEFVVLLPDTDADGAAVVGEKLRAAIATVTSPAVPVPLTASVGVASVPQDATTADGLVAEADRAMYAAKHAGRDRVRRASGGERTPTA